MRTVDPAAWPARMRGRQPPVSRPRLARAWGLEARLRGGLRDAAAELRARRAAGGRAGDACDRYSWGVLVTASALAGAAALALSAADVLARPPLLVGLQSAQHSIAQLPFPAVALCSFNVISLRALRDITDLIVRLDRNRTYSPADVRQNLLDTGALLTLALPKVDLQFVHYLQSIAPNEKLNITKIMLGLAPTCDSLLTRCSWAGKEKPCDRLFATRITSVGVCCVFNGRYEDFDRQTPPRVLKLVGQDNGLAVVIREDRDDFAYIRKPSVGIEVLTFDGAEYPFLEGGSVRAQPAPPRAAVHFTVTARAQLARSNLHYYSEAWRGCRLPLSGARAAPRWRRSYSWCLLECRRAAALQLCGCVPYTLQPRQHPVCTLNELSCLNKHREKFMYYHPVGYSLDHPDGESLSEELQDALFCPQCRADCARTVYVAQASYAEYRNQEGKLFRNRFTHGLSMENSSVLRFFYSSEDQYLYAVMSNYDWFEVVGFLSSQWVTLLGTSLVTLFEVVFCCTVRWRHHYLRRTRLLAGLPRRDIC